MKHLQLVFSFIMVGLGMWLSASAQFIPDPLSIIATPAVPSPNQNVLIQAATPTFDKNTARFDWNIDGRARPDLSGIGKNSFSLLAGTVGTVIRVRVEVSRAAGSGGTASLTIPVEDLVLSWSAETYIPRWYKGKALPTPDSLIDFVAIPHFIIGGKTIPPERLIYEWDLDDQKKALSGVGEQIFQVRTSPLPQKTYRVELRVKDQEQRVVKTETIFLAAQNPRVVIYGSTPLGGGEGRSAISALFLNTKGLFDFLAEPFFFPISSKKQLSYEWNVAGTNVLGAENNPSLITIDTGENPLDTVFASVRVRSNNNLIPTALKTFNLLFQ